MQPAAACRFSRAGALQFVKGTRFFASSQVTPVQRNASPQAVQPSAMAAPSAEPLASSFIQPLPIPGIRRAPRTPTLPSDSKFVKYAGTTGDRLFPFVLTATFLLPLGLCVKYL